MSEITAPRILVLDDELFIQKLIIHTLNNLGFTEVIACSNGHAALQLIDHPQNRPNIILCDLNMPEMDGIEFLRRLVEHRYTGSLILVSGESDRILHTVEKLVWAHHIPLLGCLNKPVSPTALAALLHQWSPPAHGQLPDTEKAYDVAALRKAIDQGELVNYYQPKVEVASGRVVGVETLVRWQHPKDGLVLPDHFIGMAEENGLIDDLTRVVLVNALRHARAWQDTGYPLLVAINISMNNLASLNFVDFVTAQADLAGVAPQDVLLEITESRLMQDLRAPLEILTRLRLKRFQLSIDDFGTGHSSLSQLRDIPFNELKIDRGFVHGAWHNDTVRAIYDASLSLAKHLGMEVVAEGVEDLDDWNLLRRTGCDLAQGYFIAKPMPAADLLNWLQSWNSALPSG